MAHHLYVLTFPNGKRYFGIAIDAAKRFSQHRQAAKRGSRLPVHCAIRKHGADAVVLRVCCIGNKAFISDLEIKAIAAFGTRYRASGYNVCVGGETGPMVDRNHSPASRAKMSVGQKARIRTDCDPIRMSAMARSRQSTDEWRSNLSRASTERWAREGKATPNEKQLAALAVGRLKRVGPCSPETRAKISAKLKGIKTGRRYERTPEMNAKQSATMKARFRNDD